LAIRHHRVAADACAVSIAGELDLGGAAELRRTLHALLGQGFKRLILDLTEVTLIDSTSLSVLVALHKELPPDGSLSIAAARTQFARLLDITGLRSMFGSFTVLCGDPRRPVQGTPRKRNGAPHERGPWLTRDAAVLAAIADTAIPFARTRDEQAARWLRVLRGDRDTRIALVALAGGDEPRPASEPGASSDLASPETIVQHAAQLAGARGAAAADPRDLLAAVLHEYRVELQPTLEPDAERYDAFIDELANGSSRHTI
jgi:anti-sigma B factor antagonist